MRFIPLPHPTKKKKQDLNLEYLIHSRNCQSGGPIQNTSSVYNSSETAHLTALGSFSYLVFFLGSNPVPGT